jgi:hypothetical protein
MSEADTLLQRAAKGCEAILRAPQGHRGSASAAREPPRGRRALPSIIPLSPAQPGRASFSGLVAPVVESWMQAALLHLVAVARDASASFVARASVRRRDWRGRAMEETMPLWTISELMHLTRDTLCDLAT